MGDYSENIRELIRNIASSEQSTASEYEDCGCIENEGASHLALRTPDSLAEMMTFAICGHKIPYNEEFDTHKFSYNLSKKEINGIESVWANKEVLYDEINGIINNHSKKDLPFNLFRYIFTSIPKIGYSRAGLMTQIILGYLGCFDHEGGAETDSVDTSTKAYNNFMRMMQRNASDPNYKKIWKNWLNIVGQKAGGQLTENRHVGDVLENNTPSTSIIGRTKYWNSGINSTVISDK